MLSMRPPMVSLFPLMALATLLSAPAPAATFHVAPDGNDRWSGTLAAANAAKTDGPLATLAAARDAIRALKARGPLREPVTVLVAAGTYRLAETLVLEPGDSGTAECPVTYAAAPGARPVISGGRAVTGWAEKAPGLWAADVPEAKARKWPFRQLWIDGRRAVLARSPNEGFFRVLGAAATAIDPATKKERDSSKSAFRFKQGDIRPWGDLRDANATVFYHWETGMLRIKSVDEATGTVTFTGDFKWPFWGRQRYYVENVLEALDAPGEWHLACDEGRLHYRPRPGEEMGKIAAVAPVLVQLVRLAGNPEKSQWVEHVRFEGLSFQHADYVLEPEGHSDWQAAVTVPAAFDAVGARACSVQRCDLAHLGGYAIALRRGSKNNRIVENHLHDLAAGGVRIGDEGVPPTEATESGGNQVVSNFIHDLGRVFYGAIGVWIGQSSDNLIAQNEVCDLGYTGISCGWSWGYHPTKAHRNRIEYNYVHHIGPGKLCDMAGIYTLGVSPGTVVRGNLIHDVWDWEEGYGAGGIYPDEGSSQILIENNITYRTSTAGLSIHYGQNLVARNNIFALGHDQQVYLGRRDKDSSLRFERNIVYYEEGKLFARDSTLEADNNLYWNAAGEPVTFLGDVTLEQWRAKGLDAHSVVADPKFVDAARFDFRLKPDSPALRLGFQPIDPSRAGLTGPPELIQAARAIVRPPVVVPRSAKTPPVALDDGFENTPVGMSPDGAAVHGEALEGRIRVSEEAAAAGKRSLKFTNATGPKGPINPHVYYSPNFRQGMVVHSFDLRVEPGAAVWVEWRDASSPYRIGPSLRVDAKGNVAAHDKALLAIPSGQWVRFEIVCGLGKKATGVYDLTVTVPGQPPRRFEKLPCDPKCKELAWLGFVSVATGKAVFYVDNLKLHP
jgi:hypothetical protein